MKTKTLLLTLMFVAMSVVGAFGDKLQLSTTLPADGKPEHLYTMKNGNGWGMLMHRHRQPKANQTLPCLLFML